MLNTTTPFSRQRVLTGLRANTTLTLGNYLGGILPMANLAKKYASTHDFFMFVPDLHSFTTPIDHSQLYDNVLHNVKTYIAAGAISAVDDGSIVYRQSFVSQHAELTWILQCFTYMGELGRMTQFKEKSASAGDVARKSESVSAGLFSYPVLMAADILLYSAMYVPLGDDQKQHLELTRDIALRINERFKGIFSEGVFSVVPAPWQQQLEFAGIDSGLRIRSLKNPHKKMSKSDADAAGSILLSDKPADAAKKIMSATTDSEARIRFDWGAQPGITNLMQILALLTEVPVEKVVQRWEGKTQYGDLKKEVARVVADFLVDFQARFDAIADAEVEEKLLAGERRARAIAGAQLLRAQQAVGLRRRL